MYQEIAAYATVAVLLVNAYYILKFRESVEIQRKSAQGSLILSTISDFFYREPHKTIIRKLEGGFTLRGPTARVSDEDLDDHIGFLDTIGTLVRTGILDFELAWASFSHYIESAYESPEIAEYIRKLQESDPTLFEDFEWFYERTKPKSEARREARLKGRKRSV